MTQQELEALGLRLGADVPFCLRGGLQRAQGVGEKLTPMACRRAVLAGDFATLPGLSTREVFGRFRLDARENRPDTQAAARALAEGTGAGYAAAWGMCSRGVSAELRPEIGEGIAALREHGAAGAWMTGSGSAVFGLFTRAQVAREAQQELHSAGAAAL